MIYKVSGTPVSLLLGVAGCCKPTLLMHGPLVHKPGPHLARSNRPVSRTEQATSSCLRPTVGASYQASLNCRQRRGTRLIVPKGQQPVGRAPTERRPQKLSCHLAARDNSGHHLHNLPAQPPAYLGNGDVHKGEGGHRGQASAGVVQPVQRVGRHAAPPKHEGRAEAVH